jgi:hypothetical protein
MIGARTVQILYTGSVNKPPGVPDMALKPPPIDDVLQQFNALLGNTGLRDEVGKSTRSLAQAALARLELVNREEFDAQVAVLARTRARVAELEAELEALTRQVEAQTGD